MGTASLILGILAIIMGLMSPIVGLILGIVGVVLGSKGKKQNEKNSKAGFVLSIIGIVIAILTFVVTLALLTFSTSSTIDNSRKDTFGDVAAEYVNATRNANLAEEIECTSMVSEKATDFKSSADLGNGDYYLLVATSSDVLKNNSSNVSSEVLKQAENQTNDMLEVPIKSAWGNKEVYGFIHWTKETGSRDTYYVALVDEDGHGIANEVSSTEITRDKVETKDAKIDVSDILDDIDSSSQKYYCHLV